MDLVLSKLNLTLDNVTLATSTIRQGLIEQYSNNRKIDDPAYHILIVLYSTLIIFGATGNCLVVMAVARKPQMRTARNMFIVNLAVSGEPQMECAHFKPRGSDRFGVGRTNKLDFPWYAIDVWYLFWIIIHIHFRRKRFCLQQLGYTFIYNYSI